MSNCWTDCKTALIVIKPQLPPSARRAAACFPLGARHDGSAGLDSADAGAFSAAARCVMPAAFPMCARHAPRIFAGPTAA